MLLSRQGISLTIWMIVFTVVITVVVALRFWAVRIKKRALRPDDGLIIIAYASTLALQSVTWWAIANGLGAHTSELNSYELDVQYKTLLASGIAWLFATVCCKLSILWLYTCLFTTRRFKLVARTAMFIISSYGIAFLCVFFTNCHPFSYSWRPVPGGSCKDVRVEVISSVSVNMVIDTFIVILPMPPLWGLQMAPRKKVAISGLFGLGLLVVAIMGWRIQVTIKSTTTTDFVYGLGTIDLVAHLEVWLGIIIACFPTLAPLFARYLRPVLSRMSRASGKHGFQGQLKEAQHTIGSPKRHGFGKSKFNRLDADSLLELEHGENFSNAKAMVESTSIPEEDEPWKSDPNAIGVRHGFEVCDEP